MNELKEQTLKNIKELEFKPSTLSAGKATKIFTEIYKYQITIEKNLLDNVYLSIYDKKEDVYTVYEVTEPIESFKLVDLQDKLNDDLKNFNEIAKRLTSEDKK